MANPALSRQEAAQRAGLLSVDSYDIDLDLTTSESTFRSTTTVVFSCRQPGASTWITSTGSAGQEPAFSSLAFWIKQAQ